MICNLPAPTINVTSGGLQGGGIYSYAVEAIGKKAASPLSTTVEDYGFVRLSTANYELISWPKVQGALKYRVYKIATNIGATGLLGVTTGTSLKDVGQVPITSKVKAVCK